jgi:tRNA(Ile)-lysidine synthase TilS/MesJ
MNNYLCYSTWEEKYKNILNSISNKTIVVSFSGGKDSSVLLHFFLKAAERYSFKLEAHGVAFPCHVMTQTEQTRIGDYWESRNIEITWHNGDQIDDSNLDDLANRGESPCVFCSQIKKKTLFSHFKQADTEWQDIVVVLGYSLWDLVSASIEHTLRTKCGNLGSGKFQGKNPEDRFQETSQRFYSKLNLKDGLIIFKPLITYNDKDIHEVITQNKIPLTRTNCKHKPYRPKRLLGDYYETFGLNFEFDKVFNFAKNTLGLPDRHYFENQEMEDYVNHMI